MTGFIVMQREALDHPLLKDGERFRAFFWLVARACWKPTKFDISGKTIELGRGQFVASRSQLAEAWGWSPSAVERFLTRLETEQMIGRETGQGRTVITICNYAKYQDVENETGQAAGQGTGQRSDSDRTAKEQGNQGTIEEEAKASPSKARKARAPFVRPDWVPEEPWDAFVAMRIRIKKPMTDHAKGLAVGELAKLAEDGHPPGDVLNQSTFKSYLGLFPLKDQGNGNRSGNRNHAPGHHGGRDNRDGIERALDRQGYGNGPAGRSGAGESGGSGELPFAIAAPVR